MGISSLNVSMQGGQTWSAQNNITGSSYSPTSNSNKISKSVNLGTGAANAALGGADELISFQSSISASSSLTIDLTSLTDILQTAGVNLARVKAYCFRLLNATDDPVYGTAASSVTIGNAASNSQQFNLSAAATFQAFTGGFWEYMDLRAAGFTVDGTHKSVKILNNDAVLAAEVQITLVGGTS